MLTSNDYHDYPTKAKPTMSKFVLKSSSGTFDDFYATREQAEQALEEFVANNCKETDDDGGDLHWNYDEVKATLSIAEVETDFFVFEFYYDENGQLTPNKLAEFDTEEEAKAYSEPLNTPQRKVICLEGTKRS
ncbi:MAG: hypothetical protein H9W81_07920 [Enterococcus sp.]|nr:hypothetical protein [Enterococcus sp.]